MGVRGVIQTIADALAEPRPAEDPAEEFCQCERPLLDDDLGAVGEGDGNDFCWRCNRFTGDD